MKFIGKTIVFDDLEGCMCEGYRYQKNIKNETKIHPKFNGKSIPKTCSKKESQNMKTYPKSDPKMEPKSIKNHSKNRCEKRKKKEGPTPTPAWGPVSPGAIISKDILRSEVQQVSTLRESMRGEYKVECKK